MFKRIFKILIWTVLPVLHSCTSVDIKSTQVMQSIAPTPKVKDNRYVSSQTYFSVDIPSIMNAEKVLTNEYGLGMDSIRVVVNFGPELPNRTVFTVQVADKHLYDEVSSFGNVDIFASGPNNSIRNDFSEYFFQQLLHGLTEYKFKQLVHYHFEHRGSDVTYAVYKDLSNNKTDEANYIPPDIYYVFYLTEMENRGVLVWLQIPIVSKEIDGRSELNLVQRKWTVQNDFFNSLRVSN